MILATVNDTNKKTISFIYYNNNTKSISNVEILDMYKFKYNTNILGKIYDFFKLDNNCIWIAKEENYDIYYDEMSGFKHFIKNGKEDWEKFYLNNGYDSICFFDKNSKENKHLFVKTFVKAGVVVNLSLLLCLCMNFSFDINNALNYIGNSFDYAYSNLFDFDSKDDEVSSKDMCDLILNSNNIDKNIKEYLANQDLFDDLLPYYKNTYMEYIICNKMKAFNILNMDSYIELYEDYECETRGLYISCFPNYIFVDKTLNENEYKSVVSHEFIHFLQGDSPYKYLKETSAELINMEYYKEEYKSKNCYKEGIINLKLLIQTIGEEPILKAVFSNDSDELNNILINNLSKQEYEEFIEILYMNPYDSKEKNKRLEELISTLYKNIYNKNMYEDINVIYELERHEFKDYHDIYYFNSKKKKTTYNYELSCSKAFELGLITKKALYKKEISYDEYKECDMYCNFSLNVNGHINGEVIHVYNESGVGLDTFNIEEANKRGMLTFYKYAFAEEIDDKKDWEFASEEYVLKQDDSMGNINYIYMRNTKWADSYSITIPNYTEKINNINSQKRLVKNR